MPFVFSTLTAPQAYTLFEDGVREVNLGERICVIKGGAGVANRNLVTPRGVATEVTDRQLELLNKCPSYLRHKAAGFIREESREIKIETAVSNMNERDESSPKTPEDYAEGDAPVVVNSEEKRSRGRPRKESIEE